MEPPGFEKVIDGYGGFLSVDKDCNLMAVLHWEHRFNHMVKRYNEVCRVQILNIMLHVCRYTYCSNMAKSNMNPKTLQYLMDIVISGDAEYIHAPRTEGCCG